MIEFVGVGKAFSGRTVLEKVDFKVREGEILVLIGASGSGKSTLLQIMNQLLVQDYGRVLFAGRDVAEFELVALRRQMGYVIQSAGLFMHWTVLRNVMTVPLLLGWEKKRAREAAMLQLEAVGLPVAHFAQLYPHELSGGQAQRVGVARALAGNPPVLLMDEPFGALDPITRESLQQLLLSLQQQQKKTIVFVTHDMDEALRLGDRILLLQEGRVAQCATPLEILTSPANDFVRRFVGEADLGLRLLAQVKVKACMQKSDKRFEGHGEALTSESSLKEALSRFIALGVEELPVVNEAGEAVGMLALVDVLAWSRR